jgi:hypothetical protein
MFLQIKGNYNKTRNVRLTQHWGAFANYCCSGKAINSTCLCVRACVSPGAWACAYVHVVLLIQHATPICHIVAYFVAPQSPPYFSTLSHKRRVFRKNVIEHKIRVSIFYTMLFETFLILRRTQRDMSKMWKHCHVKYPLFLSDFNQT